MWTIREAVIWHSGLRLRQKFSIFIMNRAKVFLCELCYPIAVTRSSYEILFNRKEVIKTFFVRKYQTYNRVYFFIQGVCTFCLNNQSLHCLLMPLGFNISLYSWELKAKCTILYCMASCLDSNKAKDFCNLSPWF